MSSLFFRATFICRHCNIPFNATPNARKHEINCGNRKNRLHFIVNSTPNDERHKINCGNNKRITNATPNAKKHGRKRRNDKHELLICSSCSNSFSRRDTLVKHVKHCTGELKGNSKRKTPCLVENCTLKFLCKSTLLQHLVHAHPGEVHLKPAVTRTFASLDEFYEWKEKEEENTFSYFVLNCGSRRGNVKYYYCQHDGSDRPHSVRKTHRTKSIGRIKTGKHCIAKMTVRIGTDNITVEYCPTHSHTLSPRDFAHHPLPSVMNKYINEQIAAGASANSIYENIGSKFLSNSNMNFSGLKRRISQRIRKKLRSESRVHVDAHASQEFEEVVVDGQYEVYNLADADSNDLNNEIGDSNDLDNEISDSNELEDNKLANSHEFDVNELSDSNEFDVNELADSNELDLHESHELPTCDDMDEEVLPHSNELDESNNEKQVFRLRRITPHQSKVSNSPDHDRRLKCSKIMSSLEALLAFPNYSSLPDSTLSFVSNTLAQCLRRVENCSESDASSYSEFETVEEHHYSPIQLLKTEIQLQSLKRPASKRRKKNLLRDAKKIKSVEDVDESRVEFEYLY